MNKIEKLFLELENYRQHNRSDKRNLKKKYNKSINNLTYYFIRVININKNICLIEFSLYNFLP